MQGNKKNMFIFKVSIKILKESKKICSLNVHKKYCSPLHPYKICRHKIKFPQNWAYYLLLKQMCAGCSEPSHTVDTDCIAGHCRWIMRHTSHFIDMDDENIKVRSGAENIFSVQLNVYFCLYCLLLLGR